MASHVVWLACFPDGAIRPVKQESRHRYRVPPLRDIRDALVNLGGPGFDEKILWALRPKGLGAVSSVHDVCGTLPSAPVCVQLVALARIDTEGCSSEMMSYT